MTRLCLLWYVIHLGTIRPTVNLILRSHMLKTWSLQYIKSIFLLVPQDIESQTVQNSFPISKSYAQNSAFIINETDLCEGCGLERHANTLYAAAREAHAQTQRDEFLVLLPWHERLSETSESTLAHILPPCWQLPLLFFPHKGWQLQKEMLWLSGYGNGWSNLRIPDSHPWLIAQYSNQTTVMPCFILY